MKTITPIIGAWPTAAPAAGSMALSGIDVHVSATQTAGGADATYDVIGWDGTRLVSLGTFSVNSGTKGGTAKLDVRAGYCYTAVSCWISADANSATLTINGNNGTFAL